MLLPMRASNPLLVMLPVLTPVWVWIDWPMAIGHASAPPYAALLITSEIWSPP